MKRLIVGVFVSALTMFGLAPAASAATSDGASVVKVVKVKKFDPNRIDWDFTTPAAPTTDGGVSTQRIDWD